MKTLCLLLAALLLTGCVGELKMFTYTDASMRTCPAGVVDRGE